MCYPRNGSRWKEGNQRVGCEELVERCINRLKQWRGLATRYEKRAVNHRAMVIIASIIIWLDL